MNKTLFAWLSAAINVAAIARGQGTFQNLDFEAARIILLNNSVVDIATTNALPSWTASAGTNQLSIIPYNSFAVFPQVGFYGSNFWVISGTFSVLLRNNGAISQTGLVSADAESLLFKGSWSSLTPLGVSLGGQSLSFTAISNGPNYTLYGADISAFAGQTATVTFLGPSSSFYFIDDIQFSPQVIPEPSSLALCLTGGILAAHRLIRRRKT